LPVTTLPRHSALRYMLWIEHHRHDEHEHQRGWRNAVAELTRA
jgi:hypothetical protein